MADATRAAFSFEDAAPFMSAGNFTKSDTNGFRTLVDRADDPQARPGIGAALVLPQPVSRLARPFSLRRLREDVTHRSLTRAFSVLIESELKHWILVLTRFRDANRYPLRETL
jgi:hypothetical protein